MKKLLLLIVFLLSVNIFAHNEKLTKEEKKIIYDYISLQLEKGEITTKQAQKMWFEATKCCREQESA